MKSYSWSIIFLLLICKQFNVRYILKKERPIIKQEARCGATCLQSLYPGGKGRRITNLKSARATQGVQGWPGQHGKTLSSKTNKNPGGMVHAYNPST